MLAAPSSPDHAQHLAKNFNDELLRLRHAEFRTQQLQDRAHFASILAGERQRADEAAAQDQAAIRLLLERVAELEAATRCPQQEPTIPVAPAPQMPPMAPMPRQGVPSRMPSYSGSSGSGSSARVTSSGESQSEMRSSPSRSTDRSEGQSASADFDTTLAVSASGGQQTK